MTNRAYHLPRTAILTLFFAAFAQAGDPAAYVSSFAQNFISTLNPDTGLITKVANAGANAANFVISPDGTTAYVVSETIYPSSTGSLNVVSLATGKVVSTISGIAPGG